MIIWKKCSTCKKPFSESETLEAVTFQRKGVDFYRHKACQDRADKNRELGQLKATFTKREDKRCKGCDEPFGAKDKIKTSTHIHTVLHWHPACLKEYKAERSGAKRDAQKAKENSPDNEEPNKGFEPGPYGDEFHHIMLAKNNSLCLKGCGRFIIKRGTVMVWRRGTKVTFHKKCFDRWIVREDTLRRAKEALENKGKEQ